MTDSINLRELDEVCDQLHEYSPEEVDAPVTVEQVRALVAAVRATLARRASGRNIADYCLYYAACEVENLAYERFTDEDLEHVDRGIYTTVHGTPVPGPINLREIERRASGKFVTYHRFRFDSYEILALVAAVRLLCEMIDYAREDEERELPHEQWDRAVKLRARFTDEDPSDD